MGCLVTRIYGLSIRSKWNANILTTREAYIFIITVMFFDFCEDGEARIMGLPTLHEGESMDVDITIDVNGIGFWYFKNRFGHCGIYNWRNTQGSDMYIFLLEDDIISLGLPNLDIGETREIGISVKYKSTDKN